MCELFGQVVLWLFRSVSLSNWIEILKVVGAATALAIGVRQYNRAQIWKRLEFLSAEMRIFFDDVAVQAAMKMLDWRRRKIALFKSRGEDNDELRTVDYDLVSESLRLYLEHRTDCGSLVVRHFSFASRAASAVGEVRPSPIAIGR